jgi:hypothetical protein
MAKKHSAYYKEGILKWLMMTALLFSTVAGYSGNTASFQKQHIRIELVCAGNINKIRKAFSYKELLPIKCKQHFFYTDKKLWVIVVLLHNSFSSVNFNATATKAFSIKLPRRFRQLKTIPQSNCNCGFISVQG